jgi:hypothetical protein
VARSKKGDGVLTVNGGAARLVLEMSDSTRTVWNDYLDEAERNREASASLGLVPSPAQNGGHSIRCLGSRRIVMAFDPESGPVAAIPTVPQPEETAWSARDGGDDQGCPCDGEAHGDQGDGLLAFQT